MSGKVFRPLEGRVYVKTPFRKDNRGWLKGLGVRPEWDKKSACWRVARKHLELVVQATADRFGECQVWADYNTHAACTKSCREAAGPECVCGCLGKEHGGGRSLDLEFITVVDGPVTRVSWIVHNQT